MGFLEDVERILAETPERKVVALFSATMPPPIRRISKRYLHDPVEIHVKARTVTVAHTRQRFLFVSGTQKMDALTRILEVEPYQAVLIFVRTKSASEDIAERLRSRGFAAQAINGDLNQPQRERVIGQFRTGALDLLVATDVAARGLDVDRITHVINYDIPSDTESYIHRIGRTGRAGRSGEAVLFVTPRERGLLNAIEKATRQSLTEMDLPTAEDVNAQRVAKFHDAITAALAAPGQSMFKGLVLEYSREHNVPMPDIAAALAVLSQDGGDFLLSPDQVRAAPAPAERKRGNNPKFARYRIDVGHRHRVSPAQIVGAIANEGGLDGAAFGKIEIHAAHSIVELPQHLPTKVLAALAKTCIADQPIRLRREPVSTRPSRR
jgi:ATP-dependent RNA helicase DeaD